MTTKKGRPESGHRFEPEMNYSKKDPYVAVGMTNPPAVLKPRLEGEEIFADIKVCVPHPNDDPGWRKMLLQLNADGFIVLHWPDSVRAAVPHIKPRIPGFLIKAAYQNARRFLEFQSALMRIPTEFQEREGRA